MPVFVWLARCFPVCLRMRGLLFERKRAFRPFGRISLICLPESTFYLLSSESLLVNRKPRIRHRPTPVASRDFRSSDISGWSFDIHADRPKLLRIRRSLRGTTIIATQNLSKSWEWWDYSKLSDGPSYRASDRPKPSKSPKPQSNRTKAKHGLLINLRLSSNLNDFQMPFLPLQCNDCTATDRAIYTLYIRLYTECISRLVGINFHIDIYIDHMIRS